MMNWIRRLALLSVVAVGIVAVACGGSPETTPSGPSSTPPATTLTETPPATSPAATTAPPATVQPVPTGGDLATAATQYSAAASAYHQCGNTWAAAVQQFATPVNYPDFVPASRDFLVCIQAFRASLYQISYPADASKLATSLAGATQAAIGALGEFIAAPSAGTWQNFQSSFMTSKYVEAAVRTALKLGPAVIGGGSN
jgi:hypothetical protein